MAKVLTVREDLVRELYSTSAFYDDPFIVSNVLSLIQDQAIWVNRLDAEKDPSLRQIVACAVMTRGQRVLCVRRSKKSNRPELRLKYSIMVGGHVDENDAQATDKLEHCVRRELEEEFGLHHFDPPAVRGIAVDPENAVGLLHLGVIFGVCIPEDQVIVQSSDQGEFVNGTRKRLLELIDWASLCSFADRLDPWSRLFIASHSFAMNMGRETYNYAARQMVLPFSEKRNGDRY